MKNFTSNCVDESVVDEIVFYRQYLDFYAIPRKKKNAILRDDVGVPARFLKVVDLFLNVARKQDSRKVDPRRTPILILFYTWKVSNRTIVGPLIVSIMRTVYVPFACLYLF